MSSQAATIGASRARGADLTAGLRTLAFRRWLFQSIAKGAFALVCGLALICIVAFADYMWSLPRWVRVVSLLVVLIGVTFVISRALLHLLRRRSIVEIALEVERHAGHQRNTLVTMAESLDGSGHESKPYMLARLESHARAELAEIDERRVAPRERAFQFIALLGAVVLVVIAVRVFSPHAFSREVSRVLLLAEGDRQVPFSPTNASEVNRHGPVSIEGFRVRVIPPAYSGLSVEEVQGDAPVRALIGSTVEVSLDVNGPVDGATLGFNNEVRPMRTLGAGRFEGTISAEISGAFETRILAAEGVAPAPIVRAVEIYNDAPPEGRINQPAADQLLRAVPDAPVIAHWSARDDLGLANVALKYIKSRGEGDSAKFTNGEVGVRDVAREGSREWSGAALLDLRKLDMQPGDTLVFWVEARDRNPSANGLGRSAGVAIAIAAPELAKLNLTDLMPNEIGRFLLSERQIIMHTERLHSQRTRLAPAEFKLRSNDIAAEQRAFKNTFNDYINLEGDGEEQSSESGAEPTVEEKVRAAEDERTAPHFHGIPEPPPGAPTSVKELTYAIRAMWDAEDALTNADTALALKHEREALLRLKRAQTAVRYIPPILAQSKPVDLKRRYAGELAEIKTRLEKLSRRPETKESGPLRAALADAYAALGDLQETLGVPVNARPGAVARARERAKQAADRLVAVRGGDHAATIAEAAGQLRIVEVELGRTGTGGTSDDFASRISKPLALLTQAASNLFAIADSRTRARGGEGSNLSPTNDARAAEYFRRLADGRK